MRYFIALLGLLNFSFSYQKNNILEIDKNLSVVVTQPNQTSEELLNAVKSSNNDAIYCAILRINNQNSPFVVSKYISAVPETIEHAFERSVNFKPIVSDSKYKIVKSESYKKEGKYLYCKISQITFESGKSVHNIMFYVMQNNKSNNLYELKISCKPEETIANKQCLEKIALSAIFHN